jgi:hypothetical protein
VSYIGCFADVGGTMGPNIIVQLSALGGSATAKMYSQQTNANCDTNPPAPSGSYSTWPVTMTGVNRHRDYDGDGCTDAQELWAGRPGGSTTCGDDPWNPYDSPSGNPPDVSGSWDIVMEAQRADICLGGQPAPFCTGQVDGTIVPGFYYNCKSDIQQASPTPTLTAPILCYVDSPVVTVNPQVAAGSATMGVNNCPPFGPANPKFCGDGLPGAAPPGCNQVSTGTSLCVVLPPSCPSLPCAVLPYQFADIDTAEWALSGTLSGTPATINLQGCWQDLDGFGQLGNAYLRAKINAYTGIGIGNVYIGETVANCTAGTPQNGATFVRISAVRQAPGAKGTCTQNPYNYSGCRDSDGDGCPDKYELSNDQTAGGLRDPLNRWDFFNPEKVQTPHTQTVADCLKVIDQFGKNQGNPNYTIDTDRTGIIGGNDWNLGPPDGQQTIADILAAVKQFGHNC